MAATAAIAGVAIAAAGTAYTVKSSSDARGEAEQQAQNQANEQHQAEAKMEQQQRADQAQSVESALSARRTSEGQERAGYGGTLLTGLNYTPGSGAAESSGQKTLLGM